MSMLDRILGTNEDQPAAAPTAQGAITWNDPTVHPEDNVLVLCELFPERELVDREYIKGHYDSYNGNFFTTKDGPYTIIDISRWVEIK